MLAQIIFFVALGLTILLLAHKLGFINLGNDRMKFDMTPMLKFLSVIWGAMGNFGKRFKFERKAVHRPAGLPKSPVIKQGGNDFWSQKPETHQENLPSYLDMAEEAYKAGNSEEAEALLIKAASHNPTDPRIYGKLGVIYIERKSYNDAIESLRLAVKYDKESASRHFNLALAYHGNSDKQKAISSVREAIKLDSESRKYNQFLEQLLKEG